MITRSSLIFLLTLGLVSIAQGETVLLRWNIDIDNGQTDGRQFGVSSINDAVALRLYLNFGERESQESPPAPAIGPPVIETMLLTDSPSQVLSVDSGPAFEAAAQNLVSGDFRWTLSLGNTGSGGGLPPFSAADVSRIELLIEDDPFDLSAGTCSDGPCIFFDSSLRSTLTIFGTVPEPQTTPALIGFLAVTCLRRRR